MYVCACVEREREGEGERERERERESERKRKTERGRWPHRDLTGTLYDPYRSPLQGVLMTVHLGCWVDSLHGYGQGQYHLGFNHLGFKKAG